MATPFQPIQVARMSVAVPNNSDVGVTAPTGLTPGQPWAWQVYRADFMVAPDDAFEFDHTSDWAIGIQLATSSSGSWEGWRAYDSDELVFQAGMLHTGAPGATQGFAEPFFWQWLPPVSWLSTKSFIEVIGLSRATNVPFALRANVYYKRKILDPTTLALLRE